MSLTFEQIEDCFPDEAIVSDTTGSFLVPAQWLHDFARAIEQEVLIEEATKLSEYLNETESKEPFVAREVTGKQEPDRFFCNKCGYHGTTTGHKRPGTDFECGYFAYSVSSQAEVKQEPEMSILTDADMDRHYIPVHPKWEIQTKGKGSSFRIAHRVDGRRWLVADKYLHAMLEEMARDINAATPQDIKSTGAADYSFRKVIISAGN